MALSENYRTETIGRSDCRPIVRLSADTIVRWDYRPNPIYNVSRWKLTRFDKHSTAELVASDMFSISCWRLSHIRIIPAIIVF